jgi:glucans biosynthesis protein
MASQTGAGNSEELPKPAAAPDRGTPFTREWLLAEALQLSRQLYVAPSEQIPGEFANLSYDQYRDIRFQKGASIWSTKVVDSRRPVPSGLHLQTPIKLALVAGGRARSVRFNSEVFDYGEGVPPPAADEVSGYSGFRVRYPINSADVLDEFLLFQGASYFRAVGRSQIYGLSARGSRSDGREGR